MTVVQASRYLRHVTRLVCQIWVWRNIHHQACPNSELFGMVAGKERDGRFSGNECGPKPVRLLSSRKCIGVTQLAAVLVWNGAGMGLTLHSEAQACVLQGLCRLRHFTGSPAAEQKKSGF